MNTIQSTLENNKLIAEFMGGLYNNQSRLSLQSNEIWLPYHGVCNYKSDNGKSLDYHNDWNWLMQVVEKIESLGYRIEIVKHICRVYLSDKEKIIISENIPKIEAVYNACVEFIKWYNQNKQD